MVFILSYHCIIPANLLLNNKLNLVAHASALPAGKGFAPLFYQVLEGKEEIVFTLFKAVASCDAGDIYLQEKLFLDGSELYEELRLKQAKMVCKLVKDYLAKACTLPPPRPQAGKESFYKKRSPKDSLLDINASLKDNFNLLRICSNEDFPAYFVLNGQKYVLKISKA